MAAISLITQLLTEGISHVGIAFNTILFILKRLHSFSYFTEKSQSFIKALRLEINK